MPSMLEFTLVLAALVAPAFVALLAPAFTSPFLTAIGVGTLLLGLLVGVPTGFWYHVILYRFVSTKIPLPRKWWLAPSGLHRHLSAAEHRRIRLWYRIGGVGFVLSVAGGLTAIAGLLMARW
jgi:hypothetical protein